MKRLILTVAFVVAGCSSFMASPVPSDLQKDGDCVAAQLLAGVTDPVAIETACLPGQLQSVADLIDYLLRGNFGKAHPELVPAMQKAAAEARSR